MLSSAFLVRPKEYTLSLLVYWCFIEILDAPLLGLHEDSDARVFIIKH